MSQRGLRDTLRVILPKWMQNRPTFVVGFRLLYAFALWLDIMLELALEAVWATWPGYTLDVHLLGLDPATALPLVGQARGILRGEAETDAAFAARSIHWIDDWEGAGSSAILAKEIQAWLGNTPTVRIVDRSGNWVTRASDGTTTKTSAAWDWDSVSNPERAGWWSDLWIIIYPCEWPVTGTTLASLVPIWGNETSSQVGTGHAVPREAVNAILALVAQWKGAHTWVQAILWSYDATLFVPGSPVSGDPDGTWGNASKVVNGVQVPARLADGRVRFWIPEDGG